MSLPTSPSMGKRAWYQTWNGRIFVGCLSGIAVLILLFSALVGYYLWQIKHGHEAELEASFRSQKFTLDTARAGAASPDTIANPNQYIRAHNPTIGSAAAPITIIAFIDFECPFCREEYSTFEQMRAQYEPVTRIVFKHLPLTTIHPQALAAAVAASCAHEQGAFWNYYKQLFTDQALDAASLSHAAEMLHLNTTTFASCVNTQKFKHDIEEDTADAIAIGARGTPTYLVNGKKIEGAISLAEWNTILLNELKNVSSTSNK